MQKEQGTRLHLPLLGQDRERRHVICHVCSKHNHVDYVYIESYSVHSGGILYVLNKYVLVYFVWDTVMRSRCRGRRRRARACILRLLFKSFLLFSVSSGTADLQI
jgi:hypothetical protein